MKEYESCKCSALLTNLLSTELKDSRIAEKKNLITVQESYEASITTLEHTNPKLAWDNC